MVKWMNAIVGLGIVAVPIAPPLDDIVGFAILADAFGVKIW